MSSPLKIPVGNEPDWEERYNNDNVSLNSIPESSALYHSLRQSRNAWLTSILPKFTTKSKAKGQKDVSQPPHNLRFIAKCDIEIGPHIFSETSVYEAHYLSEAPPPFALGFPTAYSAPYPPTTSSTSGTYTYPMTSYSPYVSPPAPPSFPNVTSTSTTEPGDPSLDVTPALIAQVNEAAATNPTLHNLLQTAAAGEATMDQLRTLGFFIQQLATAQQQAPVPAPPANFLGAQPVTPPTSAFLQGTATSQSPRNPDLVLEFRDNHMERFLIPREIVACEQEIPSSQTFRKDIVLYTFVPFVNDEKKFKAGVNNTSKTPTIIRFLNVSDAIWETIRSWVNEEAKRTEAWESFYDKAEASGPRAYLQYRIPNGDLITQLRMSCDTGYAMKSIKPNSTSETTSNKRNRPRKVTMQATAEPKEAPSTATQATLQLGAQESVSTKGTEVKRRRSIPKAGTRPRPRAGNGLFFINTIAPPPPLQLHTETLPAPAPSQSALVPTTSDTVQ